VASSAAIPTAIDSKGRLVVDDRFSGVEHTAMRGLRPSTAEKAVYLTGGRFGMLGENFLARTATIAASKAGVQDMRGQREAASETKARMKRPTQV